MPVVLAQWLAVHHFILIGILGLHHVFMLMVVCFSIYNKLYLNDTTQIQFLSLVLRVTYNTTKMLEHTC